MRYPTIELRVADSCTDINDAVAIAALFRCLVRALDRDRYLNAGVDTFVRAITLENKWRAQRYGVSATFIDPFRRQQMAIDSWLKEVFDFIAEDISFFDCGLEVSHLSHIVVSGTSADRQDGIYTNMLAAGYDAEKAIMAVIDWVATKTCAVDGQSTKPSRSIQRPGNPNTSV
jgi:carboxylate-amine ligase